MSHNRDLSAAAAQIGFHNSNIGIGTDAPSETITLNHANGASIGLEYGGTENGTINVNSAAMYARAGTGKHLILGSDGTERLRITSGGTVHTAMTGTAPTWLGNTMACREKFSVFQGANFGEACFNIDVDNANSFLSHNMYYNGGWKIRKSGSPVRHLEIGTNGWRFMTGADGADDSTSALTERLRITSDGKVGINQSTPQTTFHSTGTTNGQQATFGIDDSGLKISTFQKTDNDAGVILDAQKSSNGTLTFATAGTERFRIASDGQVYIGSSSDNSNSFSDAGTFFNLKNDTYGGRIGFSNNTATAGVALMEQFAYWGNNKISGIVATAGSDTANKDDGDLRFYTRKSGQAVTEKVRILSSGFVNIGNGYLTNSNSGLHVGRSSGGTAAGESVLAATLGNGSTMNNAILTVKNAGDRGSQGHASGSPLAKFEFNNGTAFEVNKNGQVRTPYQPAFMAKLSAATGQNFNGTLIFNSVNHNIGGHYNSSNGRFTAPVAGRYLFNWYTNVDTNSNSTSLWGDWLINGSYSGYRFYTYVSHSGWELLTASIIFNLSASDYVNVYVSTSGNYDGGSYGSFNGCLLG